jgi:hypothetical protein
MTTVPKRLKTIQDWFGGVITQNMEVDIPPSSEYIVATEELSAESRMRLYNESYWIRLLNTLHEEYPLLTGILGKDDFNSEIGVPYLTAHPPNHWSLNLLGKELFGYLVKHYEGENRSFILQAAEVDWACQHCFFAVSYPNIDLALYVGEKAEELLDLPLRMQSYTHILKTDGHLLHYREAIIKNENESFQLDTSTTHHFILFRNKFLNMDWDILEPQEYILLTHIKNGDTIGEALEKVEVDEQVAFWVQKWLIRGWLSR